MSDTAFDLEAYRRRIDDDGPIEPTRETLERLIARHAAAIPFENIEVLARRVPRLDVESLQEKMVRQRRGGYCFEQNKLFQAVLAQAGFVVRALEARVRAGVPDDVLTGRTHMALRVMIDGVDHLADVAFGGLAPLAPIRLDSRDEQAAAGGVYRLVDVPDGQLLQARSAEGWISCYCIGPTQPHDIDHEMGNWFVATHPKAMLGANLLVARAVDAGRLTLFNDKLSLSRTPTQAPDERVLGTRGEFADVLANEFGLEIEEADLDAVMAALERLAAPTGASTR